MRKHERRARSTLKRDENQPRKQFDAAVIAGLAESLKAIGQQVPLLILDDGTIIDGECRWRAGEIAGTAEFDCAVLDKRPTAAELLLIQASIDLHRSDHKPSERAATLSRILKETGWTLTTACAQIGISQSMGSKLAALGKLAPPLLAKVDAGELDVEKAYILSGEPDHAKQLAMLSDAGKLSRDALRKRARGETTGDEVKLTSATFSMPGGYVISLKGSQVDLSSAVEVLTDTIRVLKKGLTSGLSLASQMKVMKDTAKAVK